MPIITGFEQIDGELKHYCQYVNSDGKEYKKYYYDINNPKSYNYSHMRSRKQAEAINIDKKEKAKCLFT